MYNKLKQCYHSKMSTVYLLNGRRLVFKKQSVSLTTANKKNQLKPLITTCTWCMINLGNGCICTQ